MNKLRRAAILDSFAADYARKWMHYIEMYGLKNILLSDSPKEVSFAFLFAYFYMTLLFLYV